MDKEENFFNKFLSIGFGTAINVLIGLFTTPLITRMFTPEEYGKLSLFNTYVGVVMCFACLGLDRGFVRFFYDAKDSNEQSSLLKFCFSLPIISEVLLAIVFLVLIAFKTDTGNVSYAIVFYIVLNVSSSIWQKFSSTVLRLSNRNKEYAISLVLQKIVYCVSILIITSIVKKHYYTILVVSTIISLFVSALYSTIIEKRLWSFNYIKSNIEYAAIIKYSIPFIIYTLITTLMDSTDKWFLNVYFNDYTLGVYTSAFDLIVLFTTFQNIFFTTWNPVQTEEYIKNPDDTSLIEKGNKISTLICFVLGFSIIFFKDFVAVFLGKSYRSSTCYISFLIIDSIMSTVSETTCSGIEKSKKSNLNVISALIAYAFDVVLMIILLPIIGEKGICIARGLSGILHFSLRTYFSKKKYNVNYELKKFYLITFLMLVFAIYNTFYVGLYLNIILYITCMLFTLFLYKDAVLELFFLAKSIVIKYLK